MQRASELVVMAAALPRCIDLAKRSFTYVAIEAKVRKRTTTKPSQENICRIKIASNRVLIEKEIKGR